MFNLSSLKSRTYTSECDLSKIADLVNTCAVADNLDIGTSVNELYQEFAEPDFDRFQDLCLWCDEEGNLIGFGQLWIPPSNPSDEDLCYLWFRVLPTARNVGIEAQIVRWGLQRVQMVSRERQRQTKLCIIVRESECDRATFLQNSGFVAERFFYCLERSLLQPIPMPQPLSGFTLRQVEGEHEAAAWVEMYNQTFSQHWDFHPITIEQWHADRTDLDYRPEHDLVAVNEDETLVAFCCGEIRQEQNARTGRNEGWINLLVARQGRFEGSPKSTKTIFEVF